MPLLEAIQHVRRVRKGSIKEAWSELEARLRDNAIKSRYRGQAVRAGSGGIAAEQWYRATVFSDGTAIFAPDPRFPHLGAPYGLGEQRHEIEVWRSDVLKCFPIGPDCSLPSHDRERAGVDPVPWHPIGARTNNAEKAELACGEWLAGLAERPENKEAAFEAAKAAVAKTGPLSRKAFDRAWANNIPSEWKRPGQRKKA